MLRLVIFLFAIACPLSAEAAGKTLEFYYDKSKGGALTCNNGDPIDEPIPIKCPLNDSGVLTISLVPWGWEGTATLHDESDTVTITGFCSGSVIPPSNTDGIDYNLNTDCISSDEPPPTANGAKLFEHEEWYSDLPWHQKLSTVHSNLIDQPFVIPFEALPKSIRDLSECKKDESRCMIKYGIVNVVSMHRTDTLYQAGKAPTEMDCKDSQCVEVKLDIYRYHTQTTNGDFQADDIRNDTFKYQDGVNKEGEPIIIEIPSLGFGINEATIFAPWRHWYTGHYCGVFSNQNSDAVCYDDYFTTQLIAATPRGKSWIRDYPAIFWPRGQKGTLFEKYCAKKGEENKDNACSMYLGKIDWNKAATEPKVVACDIPTKEAVKKCQQQVNDRTAELDKKFDTSITSYTDVGRYPWKESKVVNPAIGLDDNPFIGFYDLEWYSNDGRTGFSLFKQPHYVLPKKCTKQNYLGALQGKTKDIQQLEDCVLNFEIHTTGFFELWQDLYGGTLPLSLDTVKEIRKAMPGTDANQYGRTMFIYAGVPEQHIAASFKVLDDDDGLSIYEKIYNASLYTQYLPMVNPADQTLAERYYTDDFWHAILMSNHMNQTPDHFIRGIRGRTLWHNEYRANLMYLSEKQGTNKGTKFENVLNYRDFPAGFQVKSDHDLAPFHGNTCDSCHIRNGSGIPLMPNGQLPKIHTDQKMKAKFELHRDYTYSNPELPSMKMVLFDLKDNSDILDVCDDNNHTVPEKPDVEPGPYYSSKIMNFFGNSFHVNQKNNLPTYDFEYVAISKNSDDDFEIVDPTARGVYQPKRVRINQIDIGSVCQEISKKPDQVKTDHWPSDCNDVSGGKVGEAINGTEEAEAEIGFMRLLGRRLGNTPMIEMMPDETILETQRLQALSGISAGCYSLAPGTRSGDGGAFHYRKCSSGKYGKGAIDCYIGRWGWIGDRASLEDQIANAAHVEMNITSAESYGDLHPKPINAAELVRYNQTLCGPANAACQNTPANSDITEQEIRDMATYQRWIGIPNRSEYQVSSQQVQAGEKIFKNLKCDSCHVIKKIVFDFDDNMLPDEERHLLKKLEIHSGGQPEYPFISYLGTDLLMHDMGYLSQVAKAPKGEKIRYQKNDMEVKNRDKKEGEIKEQYKNYAQKIRTPALKGLRFNRFVTDSNHNTEKPLNKENPNSYVPGCDFLLHDGRACDAIEAAYLHDGPAINHLKMIENLNNLNSEQLKQLRAFLYSL